MIDSFRGHEDMQIRLNGYSKCPICVNMRVTGCLSLCVSPVQVVPCLAQPDHSVVGKLYLHIFINKLQFIHIYNYDFS